MYDTCCYPTSIDMTGLRYNKRQEAVLWPQYTLISFYGGFIINSLTAVRYGVILKSIIS